MQVLIIGFDRETTDDVSARLRDAGHQVLGATGRSSGRTLARVIRPDAVLVPAGVAGEEAWGWVVDLLAGARRVVLPEGGDPAVALSDEAPSPLPVEARSDVAEAAVGDTPPPLPAADEPPPERSPRRPPPTPPALPETREERAPPPSRREEAAAPDLEGKLVQVRFGDYHRILEVQPGASAYVIREQHQRLSRLYTPTGWAGPVRAEDIPVLDEIARGIEDAWAVLGDPELRARYEQALERGSRPPAEPRR